jgi:hypothetical protein
LNIDSLLKHIHPLLKKAIADFAKEVAVVFTDLSKEADDSTEREKIEECFNSFKRQSEQMDKAMMAKLQEQFTELSGETLDEVAKEYAVKMTAEDLRLVEVADLERQVSLETMASKVLNSVIAELNLFTQRLNEGFKRKDIDDKTNPLGPALFTTNFGEASAKINATTDQKLLIFKAFERTALQSLNNILTNANANLKSQGILPNAEVIHKSSRSGSGGSAGGGSRDASGEGGAEVPIVGPEGGVQQGNTGGVKQGNAENVSAGTAGSEMNIPMPTNMPAPSGMFDIADPVVKQIYEMVAKEGYGVLQKLMAESSGGVESRISSAGVGDQNFTEKKEVEDTELLDILNTLQKQADEDDGAPALEGEFHRASVAQNIGSALQVKSQEEGAETALSKASNDVVNLVDMLFDFILSDDYLSDSVKAIISELQVPLTKVALLDKTFFSDNKHPARLLLNELSRSGMAVEKESNILEDKTYQNISGTVKRVKQDYESETTVFETALNDFSKDIGKQNKRTQVLEKRLMDVEKGQAKSEHAEALVDNLYRSLRARVPTSEKVDEFLDTGWRDVLTMTCLKFGSHSKQWKADTDVTKKLMKSILMAKKARLDGKQMKVPMNLLNFLKSALDRISYDPVDTKRILSQLAKNYQKIAATSAEDIREELINFGGETAAAKRVFSEGDTLAKRSKVTQITQAQLSKEKEQSDQGNTLEGSSSQNILKSVTKPVKELSEEEKLAKAEKEKQFQEKIEKEQEKIASSPVDAIEETILNIDQDVFKALPDEEEKPEDEFFAGNTWFDMASSLPIGTWVELHKSDTDSELRCKLVANIRSLGKLIFANKAGAKVAERKVIEFAQELKSQESKVINDNTIFDQALENVIVNLRAASST